ncbi:deazaflavin-dependent oxidoreductase (nitroreductase family) [Nocardiopsis arvandica]|uniref:Deazaflavin-dependent oxidoreductase (Nitroreductase family) n=1 Tax=Nocardiopsis sinuspersici TaxID=501010 RepID=A0A7Y9XA95_9ACTN|nr:nitroreductase/quinone reductase family protein [Nocardiopsis sinuspersici]NYH51040.1 deazaflavin-dependent oxidoreductase (nitroreductase family) [Nocardiopsis sinuspersici]
MTEFNDRVIAEFRAHAGRVGAWGTDLVLIHHRGARSGAERINPAMSLRDGDDWLVVGSAMGAPRDPAWAVNLRAHPDAEIEAVVDGGRVTVPVRAVELAGEERETAFARFVRTAPAFGTYQAKASRLLPVIRLTRRTPGPPPDAPGAAAAGIGPDDPARTIAVRRPDSDPGLPHYGVVGDDYTILLTGADTDGRYGLIDMHVPPGGGPPPHRHDFEEMFHVVEGEVEFTFRGEKTIVRAGETVNIPARAPHFFHNSSDRDARMLCMVTPPGLEDYFSRWGQPLPDRATAPLLSEDEAAEQVRAALALGPEYAIDNLL